jgi:hypothetical protein
MPNDMAEARKTPQAHSLSNRRLRATTQPLLDTDNKRRGIWFTNSKKRDSGHEGDYPENKQISKILLIAP